MAQALYRISSKIAPVERNLGYSLFKSGTIKNRSKQNAVGCSSMKARKKGKAKGRNGACG